MALTDTPWVGATARKLYLQSGQFTSTVKTSEDVSAVDTSPQDISWDGTNTLWIGGTDKKLYLQSGQFTSTLKTSESVGAVETNPTGISCTATDTPWCGRTDDKLYLQSGQFTSTLKTSESVGGVDTSPQGISWDGTNTPWTGATDQKLYLQSGQFTSTLKTSEDVSGVDTSPQGISWDGTNTLWIGFTAKKLYLQSGQFTSTLKTSELVSGIDTIPTGIETNIASVRVGGSGGGGSSGGLVRSGIMSLLSFKHDQDSIILRVKILDSSATTGAGLTGLTSASSGLVISTIADNETSATSYTVAGSTIETITTLGTYAAPTATKCRFKEVDSTNHPGVYEIQLADARFAVASSKSLLISISGATNAAETDVLIPLLQVDPYDSVRYGMTALPNAAADAAGGLPISDAGGLDLDAILADTSSLNDTKIPQTLNLTASGNIGIDWANVENPSSAVDLSGTDIQLCDTITTYTGNTVQTGDSYALANGASGFVASKAVVDAILVDTAVIGAAGAGLTAIPWNASWDAEVQSEVQDAIEVNHLDHLLAADYDPASKPGVSTALLNELIGDDGGVSQFTANALELGPSGGGGGGGDATEANQTTIIAHLTDIKGTSFVKDTHSLTDILADTAEIGAAGAGLTDLGGMSTGMKAEVESEVNDALVAIHLDHLLAVDYDPASKPGTSTALLNELIGDDGGVSQFTANALENATSATAAAIADAVWDELQAGHVTAGSFGEIATEIAAILVDTAEIGTAGAGLTAVPWNSSWDAEVQSEVNDALVAFNVVATTDLPSNFADLAITASTGRVDVSLIEGVDATDQIRDAIVDDATRIDASALNTLSGHDPGATLSSLTAAQVNAQVVDALDTDTYAELGAVPAATASLTEMIAWLYVLSRNKITQTATTVTVRNDADSGNVATSTVSDDGTTATRGEFS